MSGVCRERKKERKKDTVSGSPNIYTRDIDDIHFGTACHAQRYICRERERVIGREKGQDGKSEGHEK